MHSIEIRKLYRGFSVRVGCTDMSWGETQREREDLATWLHNYILDPIPTEEKFRKKYNIMRDIRTPTTREQLYGAAKEPDGGAS